MTFFGVMGYLFRKLNYEMAPLVLAFVLGKLIEKSFRQSLAMSGGSFMIFLNRPITAICLGATVVILLASFFGYYFRQRKESLLSTDV